MVTNRDLRYASGLAEDLRAQQRPRVAQAIENLIRYVEESWDPSLPRKPGEFLTTGQAARALGVSIQTIKNWASEGKLETVRLGGRTMVVRRSLLDYLETIRASSNRPAEQSLGETRDEAEQRQFVEAGFPEDHIRRMQQLIDAMEERDLTAAEEEELELLERESSQIAARRLRAWIRRRSTGISA